MSFNYIEPLFRPPSEGRSLILQITNGCSWNNCTFCEMYTAPQKKFQVKTDTEILEDIKFLAERLPDTRRVFLADGDAMVLSTRRLLSVLNALRGHFPKLNRVSSYCLPRNIKNKSLEEMQELKAAGLEILYVGTESGDNQVLELVNKGESYESSRDALLKIREAGIKTSIMILNGLGGAELSRQHALNSARLASEVQPEFLSTLVVGFPTGVERFRSRFPDYTALSQQQLFTEMEVFLENLELEKTVFRSDHASNYLILKGTLGRDRERLLGEVRRALKSPETAGLRPDWMRGF